STRLPSARFREVTWGFERFREVASGPAPNPTKSSATLRNPTQPSETSPRFSSLVMTSKPHSSDYASSGVDIDAGNEVVRRIKALARSTFTPGVLSEIGSFGGLFQVPGDAREPVLVASADGVGTKLKLAFMSGRHDTVGQDLVNHCVNDILVQGARPLFFLDYLATGRLQPPVFQQLLKGFAKACKDGGCAIVGGETAQMPGMYHPGEYDLVGTIIGVVDRPKMIDGARIRPGDAIIGLPSNGL